MVKPIISQAIISVSRIPRWRKRLEVYPGIHTKTPKGNLSREVAFRNVGKDLSDSNCGDSFVPVHRSNNFQATGPIQASGLQLSRGPKRAVKHFTSPYAALLKLIIG